MSRDTYAPSVGPLAWLVANWPAVLGLVGAGIAAVNAWHQAEQARQATATVAQVTQARVAQAQSEAERWQRLGQWASYGLLALGVAAVIISLRRR